jgi:SpoIIAA-like
MLEIIEGFADDVVAVAAKGQVSRRDYSDFFVPAVENAFGRHRKVRCYYELGREFSGMDSGAVWEDLKIGVEHLAHWERVAVVTDVEWVRLAVNAFRFLVPCDVRIFGTTEAADARSWIASD